MKARDILALAADRLGGEVDVAELGAGEEDVPGTISRLIDEGIFHSDW